LELHIKRKGVFEDTDLYWRRLLQDSRKLQRLDAWGYQALLTGLARQSYTVVPRVNMVSNIGLDSGVHFKGKIVNWKLPKVGQISDKICHAEIVNPDDKYDSLFERRHFDPNPVRRVLRRTIWGG
jgi:hypothetical protein